MFYFARICLKGHVNSSHEITEEVTENCQVCQGEVISLCPHCEVPIRGQALLNVAYNKNQATYVRPETCLACGEKYPWVK